MKEKIKKIVFGYLPGFITGLIVCGGVSVLAMTYFQSKDVTYDNSESGLASTNVQGAIDELYNTCINPPTDSKYFIFDYNEEDKTATIGGIKDEYMVDGEIVDGNTKITNIVIPKTVQYNGEDYSVTMIASNSFVEYISLQEVYIPEGVTKIGGYVFSSCPSLQEVHIPSTVTEIGGSAFAMCSSLQEVYIPEGVTSIGSGVFAFCSSLQEVYIPSTVTTIGSSAFGMCTSLKTITINNVEGSIEFGEAAFYGVTAPITWLKNS